MVLLESLLYFSRFPLREGVLSMFSNGSSSAFPAYASLMEDIRRLPPPLIPEIEGFVFGQSIERVRRRVDSLTGTYLFVDFGEYASSLDSRGSIVDTQRMAATVAVKLTDSADLVETAIATDLTLGLLARLRRLLIDDSRRGLPPWMSRISDRHDIVPFVSPELKSVGWTLMFTVTAADLFGAKE